MVAKCIQPTPCDCWLEREQRCSASFVIYEACAQKRIAKLEAERDEAQAERDELKGQLAELDAEIAKLQEYQRDVETTLASAWAQECAGLRERAAVAEAALVSRDAEIAKLEAALRKAEQSRDFWHQRFYYSGQRAELAERERDELKGQLAKAKAKLAAAEKERDALAEAWLTVCHEGNVPQYGGATQADPGGILHGVRQLASMWSAEKWLREVVERARDELREKLAKGGA